jgi:hypothetical protein
MRLLKTGTKTVMVPWTARQIEGTTQKILSGTAATKTDWLRDVNKESMFLLRGRTRRLAALRL